MGGGYTYLTGSFQGTVDFDAGPGVVELTTQGNLGIFVCKFDPAGALLWARDVIGDEEQLVHGYDIAVDATGNVYLAGGYFGEGDFDPGPGVYPVGSPESYGSFVWKLDPEGAFVWVRTLGQEEDMYLPSLALDPEGNVIFAGIFEGTVDFDPGSGEFPLESVELGVTESRSYLLRLGQ